MPMTEPIAQPESAYAQHIRKWMSERREQRCVAAAASGTELELAMLSFIGEDWWTGEGITSKWVKQQLDANPNVTLIRVLIDSPGGSVFDGVAIHNLLKRSKARVEVEVIGEASSAASVIAMCGDIIKMHEGSTMMIHRASCACWGFAEDFRTAADALDTITGSITDIYETRTGRARADIEAMVKKETWMSASDAVKEGFADEVVKAGSKPAPAAKTKAKNASDQREEHVIRIECDTSDIEAATEKFRAAAAEFRAANASMPVAISVVHAEQTTAPQGAPTEMNAPPAQPKEDKTMSDTLITIRALLGLGAGAPDSDVVAAVTRGRKLEEAALKATGAKSTEEAIGGIDAMKAKVDKFDANAEELAQVKSERDKQNFETLITQGQQIPAKLTPAMAKFEREQFEAAVAAGTGAAAVERFKGWLKNAPVVIASAPKQVRADGAPVSGDAPLLHDGKSYEQLSYAARGRLKNSHPELFDLMHTDWENRGKPEKAA